MIENEFRRYDLSDNILGALNLLEYREPTKIQKEIIPLVLKGKDVIGKSQTGSGKTAAFAIPICELIDWEENLPQALVLEPTRELAVQVKEEIFHIGRKKRLKVPVIFGGMPIDSQILTLKQKSHIVVGTPGRLLDHLKRGTLSVENIKYLVIDEADLMMDMGFLEDVKEIISYIKGDRLTMLFSATMGEDISNLSDEYMKNPIRIEIESKTQTVDTIDQSVIEVDDIDKFKCLMEILIKEDPEYCIIFCETRDMVNGLYKQLQQNKLRCGMLHGLVDQRERLKTIDEFREGRFRYLVTTDVASRGIDFDNITHVINYDFPAGKENYVHRIGRTGRNGKSGKAISLITPLEKKFQIAVEEYAGIKINKSDRPNKEEIADKKKMFFEKQSEKLVLKKKKFAIFNKEITKICINGGKKCKMRAGDIVGTICSISDLTDGDIGIIDIRDSMTYVEILNGKGKAVAESLQTKTIKGKVRKIKVIK